MYRFDAGTAGAAGLAAVTALTSMYSTPAMSAPLDVVKPTAKQATASTSEQPSSKAGDVQYELWPDASRRLLFLASLDEDHDGEGALRPSESAIASAVLFVRQLPYYASDPVVGVDGDGNAVVEFHDVDELGQVIFRGDDGVEAFYSREGLQPVSFEGKINDQDFAAKFVKTFGIRFFV